MRLFRVPLLAILALLLFAQAGPRSVEAARDLVTPGKAVRMELLVLEIQGCAFCPLVKTQIQPAYERTPHARDMPMRYVDVTRQDETRLGLNRPIDTVPTIVLMRDGREVDRIAGFVGPENFLKVLSHMLGQIDD